MAGKVAIIGAGISGLAAAHFIKEAGFSVRVFEASEAAGGVLGAHREQGFVLERSASSFLRTGEGAASLAKALGVEIEEAASASRTRWVYVDGKRQVLPMRARELLSSSLLSWRGKLRAIVEPLQPSLPEAEESIADFCHRRLGDEIGRTLVGPLVTGVFAGDINALSLRACFPKLAELEDRGGLVRGAIASRIETVFARVLAGETSQDGRGISAPVGGMDALVGALQSELSETISYNTAIAGIERDGSKTVLHGVDGAHYECDALVLATPAYVSASLLGPHALDAAAALSEISYAPIAVVGLGFSEPVGESLDGFGVLVAKGESPQILGAVLESRLWPSRAPEGATLVRCMIGGVGGARLVEQSDKELVEIAKTGVSTTLGIHGPTSFSKVIRWPRGIPQYTVGHLARARRIKEGLASLGIIMSSTAMDGVSVNDCVMKGRKTAARVALQLGAGLALFLVSAALLSCGGTTRPSAQSGDGGSFEHGARPLSVVEPPIAEKPVEEPPVIDPRLSKDLGHVQIMARWLWPNAVYRRSPGRNACGVARPSPVSVEVMGGLRDVAVSAAAGDPPGSATVAVSDCGLHPRLVVVGVGEALLIQNLGTAATSIVVEHVDGAGNATSPQGLPMSVAGQTYAVNTETHGWLRFHSLQDPVDYSYALITTGAASVTGPRGFAELDLPPGQHDVALWHPPIDGKTLKATASVEITAQTRSRQVVDLKL